MCFPGSYHHLYQNTGTYYFLWRNISEWFIRFVPLGSFISRHFCKSWRTNRSLKGTETSCFLLSVPWAQSEQSCLTRQWVIGTSRVDSYRFYAAQHANLTQRSQDFALRAGNQWSFKAQQLLFTYLNDSSIETAMVCHSFAITLWSPPGHTYLSQSNSSTGCRLTART